MARSRSRKKSRSKSRKKSVCKYKSLKNKTGGRRCYSAKAGKKLILTKALNRRFGAKRRRALSKARKKSKKRRKSKKKAGGFLGLGKKKAAAKPAGKKKGIFGRLFG